MPDERRTRWKNTAFCIVMAALLLAPHFSSGFARAFSGDEPHYLLMLNSLLNDGDLDLANNYANVHAGGNQAGESYAAMHSRSSHAADIDGRRVDCREFYDFAHGEWQAGADGEVHPVHKPGVVAPPASVPEYSTHQYEGAFEQDRHSTSGAARPGWNQRRSSVPVSPSSGRCCFIACCCAASPRTFSPLTPSRSSLSWARRSGFTGVRCS